MQQTFKLATLLILTTLGLGACSQAQPASTQTGQAGTSTVAATPARLVTATAQPTKAPTEVPEDYASLCQAEISTSAFTLTCEDNIISITENKKRRETDISLYRELALNAAQFTLEADVISTAVEVENENEEEDEENIAKNQNTYGFFLVDADNHFQAVRIKDNLFNFESGTKTAELEVEELYEQTYSPSIQASGQTNHWKLACNQQVCELSVNDTLIGRAQIKTEGTIQAVGFFSASTKDETFGKVAISNLVINQEDGLTGEGSFSNQNDLKSDQGLFSHIGMSGAFHAYEADGYHFSPVVSYNYYAARTSPAIDNVEVGAKVKMTIDPEKSGSQFAGLICRSSQAGMYMAVIRVDGSYSIFRNTPENSFVMLAESVSKAILSGTQENDLILRCEGDEISLTINGELAAAVTDTTNGLNFGKTGLYTKAGSSPNADTIVFSDFMIEGIEAKQ